MIASGRRALPPIPSPPTDTRAADPQPASKGPVSHPVTDCHLSPTTIWLLQVLYTTAFSTALSFVASLATQQLQPSILFLIRNPDALVWIAALSLSSAAVQLLISYTIKRYGALVFAIIMTTRQFFSILLSSLVFRTSLSLGQCCGLGAQTPAGALSGGHSQPGVRLRTALPGEVLRSGAPLIEVPTDSLLCLVGHRLSHVHKALLLATSCAALELPWSRHLLQGSVTAAASKNGQLCLSTLVTQLQASCSSTADNATREDSFKKLLSRSYLSCVEGSAANGTNTARIMVPAALYPAYLPLAQRFNAQHPALLQVVLSPFAASPALISEMHFEATTALKPAHDGWVFPWVGALPAVDWADVLAPFQNSSMPSLDPADAGLASHTTYIPLDGTAPLLFYRTDVLADLGFDHPPATWSELVYMAGLANGSSGGGANGAGGGSTAYGVCLEMDQDCSYTWLLSSILAPYLQSNGTSQGGLFYLASMGTLPVSLMDTAAAAAALEVLAALLPLSAPTPARPPFTCSPYGSLGFQRGSCAFTMAPGYLIKVTFAPSYILRPSLELGLQTPSAPGSAPAHFPVKGLYSVVEMPGSETVLNMTTLPHGTLIPCTPDVCPYGKGSVVENATISTSQAVTSEVVVNRAPFQVGGYVGAVSSGSAPLKQQAAFQFLAFLSSAAVGSEMAENLSSPTLPFRTSTFALLGALPNTGYDPAPVAAYKDAAYNSIMHANTVVNIDVPGSTALSSLMHKAVLQAIAAAAAPHNNTVATSIMHTLYTSTTDLIAGLNAGVFTSAYIAAVNYAMDSILNMLPNLPIPAGAIAVPIVSAALAVILSAVYEVRKQRKATMLFGKVVAPGPYEDTTLLITDIQDSTALWELLPASVMDRAIKEHHQCMRKLLLKHSGYESATEGDSFILAFHCPEDALLFSMEGQVALMECNWPAMLLACEICKPIYVLQLDQDQLKHSASLEETPSVLDSKQAPKAALSISRKSNDCLREGTPEARRGSNDSTLGTAATPAAHSNSSADPSGGNASATAPGSPPLSKTSTPAPALASFSAKGLGKNVLAALVPSGSSYGSSGKAATPPAPASNKTFIAACASSWRVADASRPNIVLIFRGLRVRMGLHTGIHSDADVTYNKAAARMQYSGDILVHSKAVSDCAAGGMILLSEVTYKRLPMERLWDRAMVMHIGEYVLKEGEPGLDLYQVTGKRLMGRLGYLYKKQLSGGVLAAPLGVVAVAFVNVVGAHALRSWDVRVAQDALRTFQAEAMEGVKKFAGYLVECTDDQLLVVFHAASDALMWTLETQAALLRHDWPLELLEHEMCEELVVGDTVIFRGLRLKCGVDVGDVIGEVNAMTGRICYRGKAVTRGAQLVEIAGSSQVLCSLDAWLSGASGSAISSVSHITTEKLKLATKVLKMRTAMEKGEILLCRLDTSRTAPQSLPLPPGQQHPQQHPPSSPHSHTTLDPNPTPSSHTPHPLPFSASEPPSRTTSGWESLLLVPSQSPVGLVRMELDEEECRTDSISISLDNPFTLLARNASGDVSGEDLGLTVLPGRGGSLTLEASPVSGAGIDRRGPVLSRLGGGGLLLGPSPGGRGVFVAHASAATLEEGGGSGGVGGGAFGPGEGVGCVAESAEKYNTGSPAPLLDTRAYAPAPAALPPSSAPWSVLDKSYITAAPLTTVLEASASVETATGDKE
ncbi:MAG: hypothetical protein WDW38_010258 [Sanguina aurantia]